MIHFRTMAEKRKQLADHLLKQGEIRTEKVYSAFTTVERDLFVPSPLKGQAYMDRPLPIGKNQTISAPHMVAIMSEELELQEGMKVLEIGGGSGYHAAIVGRLIGATGKVFSIERIDTLADRARRSLIEAGIDNVEMVTGDGSVGYQKEAPYDRIYYTCAAPNLPDIVKDQLKDDGMILCVEGEPYSTQRLVRYRKNLKGKWEIETLTYCIFVPLIGEKGHGH